MNKYLILQLKTASMQEAIAIRTKQRMMRMIWKDIPLDTIISNIPSQFRKWVLELEGIEVKENNYVVFEMLYQKYRQQLINAKFNNITMVVFDQ